MFGKTGQTMMFLYFAQATVETLKETLRELQVEFAVQRKSKEDLEDRTDGLLKELTFMT